MTTPTPDVPGPTLPWECFRDPAYYDLWCVCPTGERQFGKGFHVSAQGEAMNLAGYLSQRDAENAALREALKDVTVHLIAAHSLLAKSSKKAAPSDKMFDQMLRDYKRAFERGRAALATPQAPAIGRDGDLT